MADNYYGITDAGKMRDNNEDNFIAQKILNGKYIAGCVIDGVGGYEGGEIAAELARTAILNTVKKTSGNVVDVLKKALIIADEKISQEKHAKGENLQMACVATVVLADIKANKFYFAHVGDTRLYLFRDHSLVKISHDHSFVGFLEESGRITEEAAMQHPKRNEINKGLGFDDEKIIEVDYIETGESPFLPGDILLLCSDGLSDMINTKTIAGILNSPQSIKDKADGLVEAANVAGGKDNITVVLIHNNKLPLQHEATKPTFIKKNEPDENIVAKQATEEKAIHTKSSVGVRLLAVICFLALGALAWFVYKDYFQKKDNGKVIITAILPAPINTNAKKISDYINQDSSKQVVLDSIFNASPITLNDSNVIHKDSLHIIGNGKTLVADSLYKGAAIIISPNCKNIIIDSLTFDGFNIAILTNNNALHLNNVVFKNCRYNVLQVQNGNAQKNVKQAPQTIDSAKTRSLKK